MIDVEMIRSIVKVSRRVLAQNEHTPEGERLSVRALLEIAIQELERIAEKEVTA
jgi:hypothetical protein